jgi:shikimate kinase
VSLKTKPNQICLCIGRIVPLFNLNYSIFYNNGQFLILEEWFNYEWKDALMKALDSNIVRIGMPGAGKSTIGVVLAKMLGWGFVDTDLLIQQRENRTLQDIVDKDGYIALRSIEESVIIDAQWRSHVIATGGSAVYSEKAMNHLKEIAQVVFLDVEYKEICRRVNNLSTRGIAGPPGQTLQQVYMERVPLYHVYADITVPCQGMEIEETALRIADSVRSFTKAT